MGFFNVGAYQETLGMNHNLFTHPSEYTIIIDEYNYEIKNAVESKSILDILDALGYDVGKVSNKLKNDLSNSTFITEKEKNDTLAKLELFLQQNGYLRTTN